jgi:endonuclease/exonuclease/phosphatase family metal-dependent hydrolase
VGAPSLSDTLRFVTWNIHKGIGTDGCYRLERTIEVLKALEGDVVCLQEVDECVPRSSWHRQATLIAEALGFPHTALGLNVRVAGGHYGNCTLSRRPLKAIRNVDLTVPLKKRRGGLVTQVEGKDGQRWIVANVHLGLMHLERRVQLRNLLAQVLRGARKEDAVVIAGDSNDWRNLLVPGIASREGFHVARLPDHRAGGPRTYPSRRPLSALDKILYREPVQVKHVACVLDDRTRFASDHLPLVADLHVPSRHARRPAERAEAGKD